MQIGASHHCLIWYRVAPAVWRAMNRRRPITREQLRTRNKLHNKAGQRFRGWRAVSFPRIPARIKGINSQVTKAGFLIPKIYTDKLGRDIPRIGTLVQAAPSTNNWRLLGMGPGWIMRNGALIDTNSAGGQAGGPGAWCANNSLSAEHSIAGRGSTALGAGQGYGVPNMMQTGAGHPASWGWPGATTGTPVGASGMSSIY